MHVIPSARLESILAYMRELTIGDSTCLFMAWACSDFQDIKSWVAGGSGPVNTRFPKLGTELGFGVVWGRSLVFLFSMPFAQFCARALTMQSWRSIAFYIIS
jgi:hypothetical protein